MTPATSNFSEGNYRSDAQTTCASARASSASRAGRRWHILGIARRCPKGISLKRGRGGPWLVAIRGTGRETCQQTGGLYPFKSKSRWFGWAENSSTWPWPGCGRTVYTRRGNRGSEVQAQDAFRPRVQAVYDSLDVGTIGCDAYPVPGTGQAWVDQVLDMRRKELACEAETLLMGSRSSWARVQVRWQRETCQCHNTLQLGGRPGRPGRSREG